MADAAERIKELRDRKERLEKSAAEARGVLSERQELLDRAVTIAAFVADMSEFLRTSELTETRAFIRSFVKEIQVSPGNASIIYTIPMPEDSLIGASESTELALNERVMNHHTCKWPEAAHRSPFLHSTLRFPRASANKKYI